MRLQSRDRDSRRTLAIADVPSPTGLDIADKSTQVASVSKSKPAVTVPLFKDKKLGTRSFSLPAKFSRLFCVYEFLERWARLTDACKAQSAQAVNYPQACIFD